MHLRKRFYEEMTITGEREERAQAIQWCEDHDYTVRSYHLQKGNKDRFTLKAERRLVDAVVLGGRG